jgi:membrane-associated phospholipid phosphatase
MLVASIGNPLGWAKRMLIDWLPIYLMLISYNIAWGLVDNLSDRPHTQPQLYFDQQIFGADGLVAPLQNWLWHGSVRALDYGIWIVYLSHFVITLVVCAGLWIKARAEFLAYRRRVVATWFTGLIVFTLYPTVPPWMAADQGLIPAVTRVIGQVNRALAPETTHQVLASGGGKIELANPVAAVPSMHSALPMLLLLFFWSRAPRLRPLLVAYPLAMTFTLIYAGEHYLFDVLAGWAVAALVHLVWRRWESRREEAGAAMTSPVAEDSARRISPSSRPDEAAVMADLGAGPGV